jgi:hypothetical protein
MTAYELGVCDRCVIVSDRENHPLRSSALGGQHFDAVLSMLTERDGITRNIAEVIDDLYREAAPPRDRNRLLDLVQRQVNRAVSLGARGFFETGEDPK